MFRISRDVIDMLHVRNELRRLSDYRDAYAELDGPKADRSKEIVLFFDGQRPSM